MIKIDNFTTARCKKCGWVAQFQPGKPYESEDFVCNCKAVEPTMLDKLKAKADKLGIKYPGNIGEKSLEKKINEVA